MSSNKYIKDENLHKYLQVCFKKIPQDGKYSSIMTKSIKWNDLREVASYEVIMMIVILEVLENYDCAVHINLVARLNL